MMGQLAECYRPSFVISTGDNFYSYGLRGPDDQYFKATFTDVYTATGLMVGPGGLWLALWEALSVLSF